MDSGRSEAVHAADGISTTGHDELGEAAPITCDARELVSLRGSADRTDTVPA
ncbi:hypothetical protein FHX42_002325 [Saccharopolyspora lacisalsi]|uniref:Uncharacterized protein n=1 Tax=Halosaccharopolyspora lacisalsi TaxID=1000566 RepID=A0A839E208_9PSEU|nr:hypothetical protein [Halosaccharopolyspora lacisalsi]MBA8824978.1 hypothetical protein [Halosaccharopolyspora lacisalsi]